MRAVVCTAWGPPEVLRVAEVERPVPRKGEVLIRNGATAVTASDCLARGLKFPTRYRILAQIILGFGAPRRPIFGMVFAGEIESVGRRVRNFRPGDKVFGLQQWKTGCYAEYVCVSSGGLIAKRPLNMSDEEAAALPYGGLLAMALLRKTPINAGMRVLVYGASGAIGTAMVQLAKHFGATVTGVCSTRNLALVESLGADLVVDYTREDFTKRDERYDLILDAVGKRKSATALLNAGSALRPGGKSISIDDIRPRLRAEDLRLIARLAGSGELKPVIDRSYALDEMVAAHHYVEEGHKRGNVVVKVGRVDE
jgi:NADPH:quinone reductase-like Zn-dependent oxidoreductase